MNRIIKFRARRIDNGRWVYGYFVKTPITTEFNCDGQYLDSGGIGRYCIVQGGGAHEIDIKTLGQFTGLLDKNGKEIYEGDVVKADDLICIVEWKKVGWKATWKNNRGLSASPDLDFKGVLEIIGNIYEHPHLLNPNE